MLKGLGSTAKGALLLLIGIGLSLVLAHAITFYPVSVAIQPSNPTVFFQEGNNAGQPDVSGTIDVSLGNSNTTLTITVHPTFGTVYYENISLIVNSDSKSWKVTLKTAIPVNISNWPTGSQVMLYIYNKGAVRAFGYDNFPLVLPDPLSYVASLDLTTTSTATLTLAPGAVYEIDLLVYIPDSATLPPASTASISLEASPA